MSAPNASSVYRIVGNQAVGSVESRPGATPREDTRSSRSFAELLAAAEAVRDHVELQRAPLAGAGIVGGVRGAIVGAADFLARQTPWLGLPLLMRRPVPRRPHEA